MTEQIVDIVEANMPVSSDVEAAAKGAGAAAGEYAGRQAANASLADVRALANTNKSRLDTLTAAPASGNTELVDIRVGYDGTTYPTAGDAVRAVGTKAVSADYMLRDQNQSSVPAEYLDMDTVPVQTVVTYANLTQWGVQHAPAGASDGGTLLTIASTGDKDTAASHAGAAQIYFDGKNGATWYRTKWGIANCRWGEWHAVNTNAVVPGPMLRDQNQSSVPAEYLDMDTVPVQTVVTYANLTQWGVQHAPAGASDGGTLLTIASTGDKDTAASHAGAVQIYVNQRDGRLAHRLKWGIANCAWGAWVWEQDWTAEASTLGMYERIGVIGDSYASGNVGVDHPGISWPKILERRLGNTITRYAKGGLTTGTWLTDSAGLTALQAAAPDGLYIIALGINDGRYLTDATLGSPADMTATPDNNPNTFYGNMARIIAACQAKNPAAKIILLTTPYCTLVPSASRTRINDAITDIADRLDGCVLINLDDDGFFRSDFFRTLSNNHPVAATYAGMACAIERLYAACAMANLDYFKDYIG